MHNTKYIISFVRRRSIRVSCSSHAGQLKLRTLRVEPRPQSESCENRLQKWVVETKTSADIIRVAVAVVNTVQPSNSERPSQLWKVVKKHYTRAECFDETSRTV